MKKLFLLLYVACNVFPACTSKPEKLSRTELLSFISNPVNGLSVEKQKQGVDITLQFYPKDLIVEQQLVAGTHEEFDSLYRQLANMAYFTLTLARGGHEIEASYAAEPERHSQAIEYLSNGILKDIHAKTDGKKLSVSQIVYLPAHGLGTATTLLLIFQNEEIRSTEDITVVWEDSFFLTGYSEFKFELSETHVPRLAYQALQDQ